jgi:hypothetical protein
MNQSSNAHDTPSASQSAALVKDRAQRLGFVWFWDHPEVRESERCLVLGVVAWSIYDVRLLTLISDALARTPRPDLRIAVFDLDELTSRSHARHLLTSTGIYEPPPISHWAPGPSKDAAIRFASALQRIFPGIGDVFHPPAVGYWETGHLKEAVSGFDGCQLVGRLLGFDPKPIFEQPAPAAE